MTDWLKMPYTASICYNRPLSLANDATWPNNSKPIQSKVMSKYTMPHLDQ